MAGISVLGTCAQHITADVCRSLLEKGYAVIDGFYGQENAAGILTELKQAMEIHDPRSYVAPNRTFFKDEKGTVCAFDKPHVFEVDLHAVFAGKAPDPSLPAALPRLYELFTSEKVPAAFEAGIVAALEGKSSAAAWALDKGPGRYAIKLQYNEGGGSFPWHIDNPGNNKRRLTTVCYLNDTWRKGDGGEIVLKPFMGDDVVVEPRFDRCVVFLSEVMNHCVLPAKARRFCFSVWYDRGEGAPQNVDTIHQSVLPKVRDLPQDKAWLTKPSVQRTLSRLVYEEEYLGTLRACVPVADPALAGLTRMHRQHVDGIREANKHTGLLDTIAWLRELK